MNRTDVTAIEERLRARISDELTARLRADEAAGTTRMGMEDQRQLARSLIAEALTEERAHGLRAGTETLDEEAEADLARSVVDALFGLGRLERLLEDPDITDIHVNGARDVFVRRAGGGPPLRVAPVAASDRELVEMIRHAARRVGRTERRWDQGSPYLELELPDGSRLFAVMSVSQAPCVTVRRHGFQEGSLADLRAMGMFDESVETFLAAAVRSEQNIVIGGEVGVGKTTLLRALLHLLPAEERIVTIEDSLELGLDRFPELHPNVIALEARPPNVEGEGEVTLAELVRAALRMDPDRVIVGEVRGAEVVAMLNAMSHGNDGSMCTIHANSSRGILEKLVLYALMSKERLERDVTNLLVANAVDFVVFLDREPGIGRYVGSIREVTAAEGLMVMTNEVFAPGPDGRAEPTGQAHLSDRRLGELVAAGFDPGWLRAPMRGPR